MCSNLYEVETRGILGGRLQAWSSSIQAQKVTIDTLSEDIDEEHLRPKPTVNPA